MCAIPASLLIVGKAVGTAAVRERYLRILTGSLRPALDK